jgi:hypothetical protein
MVLGHEVIGKIVHSDSEKLHEGQTVAVNPSKPCGHCKYCLAKEENQCTEMRFFGSAMYFPHVDGGLPALKWWIPRNVFLSPVMPMPKSWPLPNRWRSLFTLLIRPVIYKANVSLSQA